MPKNYKLKLPTGLLANDADRVMVLARWYQHLKKQGQDILFAGMGNPTYPINSSMMIRMQRYLNDKAEGAAEARKALKRVSRQNNQQPSSKNRDKVVELANVPGDKSSVSSYRDPQGIPEAREQIAEAFNSWYKNINAKSEDIFLTTGGAGALYSIFELVNNNKPDGFIVTPIPHYSLYQGANSQNNIHPIHVMQEPGYKLTANALKNSLEEAKKRNLPINAFLFCDPNNPLGTVTSKEEWDKIAEVLREFLKKEKDLPFNQKTPIILDEAYAEMGMDRQPTSLITIAPDLAPHIIMMRSATKALSAAGERMATMFTKNPHYMNEIVNTTININGHAPAIIQFGYAYALQTIDDAELADMTEHYKPQLDLVYNRAKEVGINMPDETYKPEGAFYIVLDLRELIGEKLNEKAQDVVGQKTKIETDEDICYHLMFEEGVMIAPLSYYGLNAKHGFMRVTCSGGDKQLNQIMDRITVQINKAREAKKEQLFTKLEIARQGLKDADKIREEYNANNSITKDEDLDVAEQLRVEIRTLLQPKDMSSYSSSPQLKKPTDKEHRGSISSDGSNSSEKEEEALEKERTEKAASVKALKEENNKLKNKLEQAEVFIRKLNPAAQKAYDEQRKKSGVKILSAYKDYKDNKSEKEFKSAQKDLLRAYETLQQAARNKYGKSASTSTLVVSRQKQEKTIVTLDTIKSILTK